VLIPAQDKRTQMRTILIRPDGPGPFPLVVINHGSVESGELREKFSQPAYEEPVRWFLRRGYAVALPLRPGHGETGGPYLESNGPCDSADFRKAGLATADSIIAAIGYLTARPFVKKTGVVVVGHSAGGWGALALASRNLREVGVVIAFAAGRGGRVNGRANNNCSPQRLIEAAHAFGEKARIPALSISAQNDTYIPADLAQKIAVSYRMGGGRIEYHTLPDFSREGHALFEQGVEIWGPVVEQFLKNVK
jgi:dienelactone hydrolase